MNNQHTHTQTHISLSKHTHLLIHSHTHTTDNKVGSEGIQLLSEVLKTNTTLASLNLSSEWIYIWIINTHTFLSLSKHIYSFIHSFILTHTTDNNIESKGVQSISEVLKTNTTLASLNLAGEWIYIYMNNQHTHISLSL
jgi:hypothetical protein